MFFPALRWMHHTTPICLRRTIVIGLFAVFVQNGFPQDAPLISGGVAFFSNTNAGNTTYLPIIEPLLAAPLGPRVLIESRAALLETFAPQANNQNGYNHTHFIGLSYLQGDVIASSHFSFVAGDFLIPFNTYIERLSPVWIGNFQDGPLITALGTLSSGSGGRHVARQRDCAKQNLS